MCVLYAEMRQDTRCTRHHLPQRAYEKKHGAREAGDSHPIAFTLLVIGLLHLMPDGEHYNLGGIGDLVE